MYLLQFLQSASEETNPLSGIDVEYRLACSGELYNRLVHTGDHRKSDITRVLLRTPLELFVVSRPFDSYPQELCARFKVNYIKEESKMFGVGGSSSTILLPDEDLIEDFCSITSLLSRRLITPVGKTLEKHHIQWPENHLGSYGIELPVPILPTPHVAAWRERPVSIITDIEGHQILFHKPQPVGVDPHSLSAFLMQFARNESAEIVVHASRLYRAALEFIESRPDIAYQLLISTVEALAAVVFADYSPKEEDQIATKKNVQALAMEFGLGEAQAEQLALEACKSDRWLKRRFVKFITEFVSYEELASKDDLFEGLDIFQISTEALPRALGRIYDTRSVNLHQASPFPKSVGYGTKNWIRLDQIPKEGDIPPVAWFERAVSIATRNFLGKAIPTASKPFTIETSETGSK